MTTPLKATVDFEDSLGRLDLRLGRITHVEREPTAHKPSYRLTVDFGRYGVKSTVRAIHRAPAPRNWWGSRWWGC